MINFTTYILDKQQECEKIDKMATQEIEGSGPQVDHYTSNIEEFESIGPIDVHIAEQILNAISQMGELYFSLMSGGFKNQSETQK